MVGNRDVNWLWVLRLRWWLHRDFIPPNLYGWLCGREHISVMDSLGQEFQSVINTLEHNPHRTWLIHICNKSVPTQINVHLNSSEYITGTFANNYALDEPCCSVCALFSELWTCCAGTGMWRPICQGRQSLVLLCFGLLQYNGWLTLR